MAIGLILFLFLLLVAAAIGGSLVIHAFVALIKGKWLRAAGLFIVSVPIVAFACVLYPSLQGNAEREAVETSEVAGTYRLAQGATRHLSRMGYKDFSGELFLGLQDVFTATNIPACCVHGEDATGRSINEEYYDLKGTWTLKRNSNGAYEVEIELSSAEVSNQPYNKDRTPPSVRTPKYRSLRLFLKDIDFYLEFPIYTGSDFNYIGYDRS